MKLAKECQKHCQYAQDVGMTEYSCQGTCQYQDYADLERREAQRQVRKVVLTFVLPAFAIAAGVALIV